MHLNNKNVSGLRVTGLSISMKNDIKRQNIYSQAAPPVASHDFTLMYSLKIGYYHSNLSITSKW